MTKLWFENECAFTLPASDPQLHGLPDEWGDPEQCAQKVICAALRHEVCPVDAELSLTVTDAESMREINRRERGIDAVTDVLSFPAYAYEKPAAFEEVQENFLLRDPDTGNILLGDILICAERVREQAAEYGHTVLREYAFLIAHSMLHLMGYDHMTEAEADEMFRRQEEILLQLGIGRSRNDE